jgi:cytochrome c-type biogenesis protein CcmH
MPLGKIALLAAAIVAAFTVGVVITRAPSRPEPAAEVVADAAPGTIESLEERTRAQPKDAGAWQRLGTAYFEAGRFADGARALEQASTLTPDKAAVWSALGEARVYADSRDPMPAQAAAAFERALAIDAKDSRARYFLAVKRDLAGDHAGAIGDWLALLRDTPADAPWRADLVRTIEQVGKINQIDVAPRLAAAQASAPPPVMPPAARGIPGPTAQDMAAAAKLSPGEQRQMADGMVSRLEARLKQSPADPDGWVMLMRSRMSLGQNDKAAQALKDAIAANPARADMLREQARTLGVK